MQPVLVAPMHRLLRHTLRCGLTAIGWATGLGAQTVPARDLWEFPLGAVFEPPAIAVEPGGGLWNPATLHLPAAARFRFGVASLASGAEQGVDGQLLSAAYRRTNGVTLGLSMARAAVAGLVRTDTDPQSLGSIRYESMLLSFGAARALHPNLDGGVSVRWRYGRADAERRDAVAADFGLVAHDLPLRAARVAVSSFLWRPGREIEDRPAVLAAADLRAWGTSAEREARVGYSLNAVNRGARESGPYAAARYDHIEGRFGYFQSTFSATTLNRLRSGLALHYERYVVGIAREEGSAGLGPIYQFTLSSIIR